MTRRLLLLSLVLAASCTAPATYVDLVGTIEMVEADVASLATARVTTMRVQQGDLVRAGDTIAILELPTTSAELAMREAELRASVAAAADVAAGARAAEIDRAAADVRAAEADAVRTARDLERLRALRDAGAISQQELDHAATSAAAAAARRDAAVELLRLARAGARPGERQVAAARSDAARAAVQATSASAASLVLVAPIAGQVVARHAEPGEVIAAGRPVATVGDPRRPWVTVYAGQHVLPRLQIGTRVDARLDGIPDRSFLGRIAAISPRAEFTPRVALTEEERDDLLFAVRVEFDDAAPALRAGLPVTVRLPLDGDDDRAAGTAATSAP